MRRDELRLLILEAEAERTPGSPVLCGLVLASRASACRTGLNSHDPA